MQEMEMMMQEMQVASVHHLNGKVKYYRGQFGVCKEFMCVGVRVKSTNETSKLYALYAIPLTL